MAQGLRARGEVSARLAGCTALLLAACRHEPPAPAPLPEDASAAIGVLLQRWHGPLQGTLDDLLVEVRRDGRGGARTRIATSGGRLRAERPDGSVDLLHGDGAWRCPPGSPPQRLDADGRAALQALRTLIAGAYLLPLYGARSVTRQGPTVFAVEAADGSTWRLEIEPVQQLPHSMTGPAGVIGFQSFFSTGVSQLPAKVELGVLGAQHLTLVASDVLFEPFVFHDPGADPTASPARAKRTISPAADDRPAEPAVRDVPGTLFLRLDDPGDWEGRSAAIVAAGTVLGEQGQFGAGLPFLYEEQGQHCIGLPFEPDAGQGNPPFVARDGQRVERRPNHRAVVVYRSGQPFAAASAAATSDVLAFAAKARLQPAGPVRILPFFNWGEAAPTAAQLDRMGVQAELPVTDGK